MYFDNKKIKKFRSLLGPESQYSIEPWKELDRTFES